MPLFRQSLWMQFECSAKTLRTSLRLPQVNSDPVATPSGVVGSQLNVSANSRIVSVVPLR